MQEIVNNRKRKNKAIREEERPNYILYSIIIFNIYIYIM